MIFYTQAPKKHTPQSDPYIILRWNNWNDYSFTTLFDLELIINNKTINLGYVKIACDDTTRDLYVINNK